MNTSEGQDMRHAARWLMAAAVLGLAVGAAGAGTIVDQSPHSGGTAYYSDASIQFIADNFTLASAAAPDSITFWGYYRPLITPLTDDFRLAFYQDSGGQPGAVVTSFAITPSRVATG